MDELLRSSMGWELKLPILLAPGVVIGIFMLFFFNKRRLARLSQVPLCGPNWLTLWSLLFYWIGMAVFLTVSPYFGLQLVVVSCLMDVFDGKMSVAMAELGIIRTAIDRWIGKWLDPLVDKLRVVPTLVIFCVLGGISHWVVLFVALPELIGTFCREPFTTIPALRGYPSVITFKARLRAEALKSLENESKATVIGKMKTLFQDLGLIAFVPFYLHWNVQPIADYVFLATVPLGVLSIVSRKLNVAWLKRLLSRADPYFKHQDIL
ncbi:MAG: CDP-alcohol phosphatidyltransferase family protein [Patescibacteria group bacterium]|nr:CDP-alcohol phosphatidyltransferase family protein [Patescibacteria group bacterium]